MHHMDDLTALEGGRGLCALIDMGLALAHYSCSECSFSCRFIYIYFIYITCKMLVIILSYYLASCCHNTLHIIQSKPNTLRRIKTIR